MREFPSLPEKPGQEKLGILSQKPLVKEAPPQVFLLQERASPFQHLNCPSSKGTPLSLPELSTQQRKLVSLLLEEEQLMSTTLLMDSIWFHFSALGPLESLWLNVQTNSSLRWNYSQFLGYLEFFWNSAGGWWFDFLLLCLAWKHFR